MANVTNTTATAHIPELWSAEVQLAVEKTVVMTPLVDHTYEKDISYGDLIHVPLIANISALQKSASQDVTYTANTESTLPINIDQHWYTAVKVEDITALQSKTDLMAKYTGKCGYGLGLKMDGTLTALYANLSHNVGDGNTNITDANLISAIAYLDLAEAPGYDRAFVIDGYGIADLRGIDKFTRYDALGTGKAITDAKLGSFYGIPYYVSNAIVTAAGTPTVVHGLLFQKEAFAIVTQQKPRTQTDNDIDSLAEKLVIDAVWGVAEMRDTFAVDYRYKQG